MADPLNLDEFRQNARGPHSSDRTSTTGGGDGTYSGMERLASVETKTEMLDKRLDRMEDKLDRVLERLGSMPTTNGLWGMVATVIGVSLTMITIVVALVAL